MIAPRKPVRRQESCPDWHARFLAMLPDIRRQASYAFRAMNPEASEDAIKEVMANACCAFAQLFERSSANVACGGGGDRRPMRRSPATTARRTKWVGLVGFRHRFDRARSAV